MNKYITVFLLSAGLFIGAFLYASAQYVPTLTATLHSETSVAKSIATEAQYVEVARITITASGGDLYINGFYVNTDVQGGLSNFSNIFIYDTSDSSLVGYYPNRSEDPNLVHPSSNIIIGSGFSKTYLLKASLAPSAAGNVRIGFSGFSYPTQTSPALSGIPIYGNVMTLPGIVISTPTPVPTPIPTLVATPTPTPVSNRVTPSSLGFTSLLALGLSEGDTISAVGSNLPAGEAGDPDIYIANEWGYKRLFLNPVIFGFYGHLGGFSKVKTVTSATRSIMVTSGLFRNCETNDPKIYGVETTGEDSGILHWVNTTGEQAVTDDPDFFKKVFCINSNEFNWYQKGPDYTSVNQVPPYFR